MSKITADLVAQQLGQIATAVPEEPVLTVGSGRKFKSRFFFVLDETLEQRKEKFKPKKLEHVDTHIVKRAAEFKTNSSADLRDKIQKIREYFLSEIAPLAMASASGAQQAQQVIERYLDGKADTTLISNFEIMMMRAAKVKLSLFVLELFGLDISYLSELSPQPVESQSNKRLNSVLDQVMSLLKKQDTGINVLTNQMRKLSTGTGRHDEEEIRVPRETR